METTKQGREYLFKAISHCIATSDTSHFIGEKIKEYCTPEMVTKIYNRSLEYHQIFSIALQDLDVMLYSGKANKFLESLTNRVFNELCILYPLI